METDVDELRPCLRGDVYVLKVPEGAYIRSNMGGSMLKGASTYEWVQRVAPMLDGSKTVRELCDSVPQASRSALAKLIRLLHAKGYVKNVLDDRPHTLSAALVENYAGNIAFIDYFKDSPELRFERYRDSTVVLTGSGPLLQALAHSQLRAGVRTPRLAPFAESPLDRDRVAEHLTAARAGDPEQDIDYMAVDDALSLRRQLEHLVSDATMVLHVADRPMIERARLLPHVAVEAGAAFAQAVVAGDEAWIGPVIGPGTDPGQWESGWRRLCALAPAIRGADLLDHPDVTPSEFLRGPTVALVANQLCFAAFRHLTGIDQGVESSSLVKFDLETLETGKHPFLPHPLAAPVVPDDPGRLTFLADAAPVDDAELSRRAVDCVDPRTGVFAEVTERDYEQLPLFVSEIVVSDPVGLAGGPFSVYGCGDTVVESRQRAVRRAFERYAAVMVDTRKGTSLHGWDLTTGETVTVDAAEVFPAGAASASGATWREAVTAAVVAAANARVVAAVPATTEPFPRLELDDVELGDRGARYRKLLATVDQQFAVYDLSSVQGLPTFAFTTPSGTVGYVSDLDVEVALDKGLELTLLAYQVEATGQPAYAPGPAPDLPESLRGETGARPRSVAVDDVVERLARSYGGVVAVPLDHDPAVARLCPFVARVVLVNG